VTGDCHAPFCGGPGARFPRATRHLTVGGEGFTFLGFHHQMVRSPARSGKRQVTFLARWPADKAMQHARDRLRELTDRSRLRLPTGWVVQEMNSFLKGWAAYFRYGNSARRFRSCNGMRACAWGCSSPNAIDGGAGSAGGWWGSPHPTGWAW
jgi:hypothetical protein